MTGALRICNDCGARHRTQNPRCPVCERQHQRARNAARKDLYGGSWTAASRRARAGAVFCARCGVFLIRSRTAPNGSTYDHETGTVECRSCNSSHRRNPT